MTFLGLTLENAAQETREVGAGKAKRIERKWTMAQLLDPEFRLPRQDSAEGDAKPLTPEKIAAMKALSSRGGIKVFKAKRK